MGNGIESMGKLKFFARFRELGKCLFPSVIWRKNEEVTEEMSEKNFQFSNPLVFFLVKNISIICENLNTNNTVYARKRLQNLVTFLDPTIKEALKDDITALRKGVFTRQSVDSEYDRILNNIVNALYEAGYFSPQQGFRRT